MEEPWRSKFNLCVVCGSNICLLALPHALVVNVLFNNNLN